MPDPFESLAVGLNEDAKAKRRAKKADAVPEIVDHDPLGIGDNEVMNEIADNGPGELLDTDDEGDEEPGTRAIELAVDRFTNIAMEADFESGTLIGDVRNTLLDLFKANPRPWSEINETDQRTIADGLEFISGIIVRKIVLIVATDDVGSQTIHGTLESYAEKGNLTIKMTAEGSVDNVVALHNAVGGPVILKKADHQRYQGERRDAGVMPDQPGLFEGEEREAGEYQGNDDDLAGDDDNEAEIADALAEQQNAAIETDIFDSQQPE